MTIVAKFDWLRLIREENWDEFDAQAKGTPPRLTNADLRMADLRRASLTRADLRGAYLRNADLRGLDLSEADLHGASLHEARISGVVFPANLAPEEIRLSVLLGTRMRTRAADRVPSCAPGAPRPVAVGARGSRAALAACSMDAP